MSGTKNTSGTSSGSNGGSGSGGTRESFEIDENSGIPLWVQVRKRLLYLISSGQYQPGEQLPTVRELAVELGINYNTVNKVYQDLERDGFIQMRRGRGTFVADLDETNPFWLMLNKIDLLADELVSEGLALGMTGDEIVSAVAARVELQTGGGRVKTVSARAAGAEAAGAVSYGAGSSGACGLDARVLDARVLEVSHA